MGRRRTKKRCSSAELTLPVGAEAELRSDDPGFHGSFYEVTVTGRLVSTGQYTVLYSGLVADDGGPLRETVAAANVRPRPPRAGGRRRRGGFEVHDAVEAFHNDGWWAGVVSSVRPRAYEVAFPTSRETMELQETALRPHRVFQAGRWVPAAAELELGDGCPLFHEGTQVEVSGSAKSFGKSWRPASVLKVIGASYFLVKYTHIGNHGEPATEILDSQYIRPAYTARKYKFSQSSRVEVMHEGRWWPCVIMEVLGGGIDKYVVKIESDETNMEDVECLDVLTVENTQLRPQVRWEGKTWLPRSEEKSATGPMLASRKRPISCVLSLHKEASEPIPTEHGSYREKKLKNADVVSEPIPPLSSVCNESSGIKSKSSSYPEETIKQGNAVLAPPSLPLTAGFAHLSDSSLAQSCHIEQSLHKDVSEHVPTEHGSYREKKLKNADVVSEPIPPLSSVCNESSEIKSKSSSYPEETMKQGNAVLAPPSLPLTAGFAHLSDSSLAQSCHVEQSLHKEVSEATLTEHGSYREKKLKNADVVSEPIPPLSFVCTESSEIKRKSSSYPGETMKQGNAVLAPPSLPLTVGFAQASSQKIISPSAPVPQSRQLHASLFGTFGQPRPLPHGPLLGMQSLNPQTQQEVIAAKSIEEARNIVSMSEKVAKQKKGDDEMLCNVTAGRGMLSETNKANCVDPATTPKDNGGSQLAVSQQGHGSAMDDRRSESLAIQHLPFASQVRAKIEAMEIFRKMPQQTNLNQFQRCGPELCEGMALGLMLSLAILAESIDRINVHQDDIGEVFQKNKQVLSLLEETGFDVRALRSRLEARLCTTRREA